VQPPNVPIDPGVIVPPMPVFTAFTGRDGAYALRGLPPAEYRVEVAVPRFTPQAEWVNVEVGQTTALDFVLDPKPEPDVGRIVGSVVALVPPPPPDAPAAAELPTRVPVPVPRALVTVTTGVPWVPPWPQPHLDEMAARSAQRDAVIDVMPPIMPPLPEPDRQEFATLTDWEGNYSINVPAGPAQITAYHENWGVAYRTLRVPNAGEVEANLTLEWLYWIQDGIEPPPPPAMEPQ
jgi:hypothetical protein